ncbi:hypothetical protein BOX15_Mlig025613g2, partial [Macrostomum lignano]
IMVSIVSLNVNKSDDLTIQHIPYTVTTPAVQTLKPEAGAEHHAGLSHFVLFVIIPLLVLLFLLFVGFVVVLCMRKLRLDKLRHRLMPLYQFDPADADREWEADLLEDEREQQQRALRSASTGGIGGGVAGAVSGTGGIGESAAISLYRDSAPA